MYATRILSKIRRGKKKNCLNNPELLTTGPSLFITNTRVLLVKSRTFYVIRSAAVADFITRHAGFARSPHPLLLLLLLFAGVFEADVCGCQGADCRADGRGEGGGGFAPGAHWSARSPPPLRTASTASYPSARVKAQYAPPPSSVARSALGTYTHGTQPYPLRRRPFCYLHTPAAYITIHGYFEIRNTIKVWNIFLFFFSFAIRVIIRENFSEP